MYHFIGKDYVIRMKKNKLFLSLLCMILTSGILIACSTTTTNEGKDSEKSQNTVEVSVNSIETETAAQNDSVEESDIIADEAPIEIPTPIIRMESDGFYVDELNLTLSKTTVSNPSLSSFNPDLTTLRMNYDPTIDNVNQQALLDIYYTDATLDDIANELQKYLTNEQDLGYGEIDDLKYLYYFDGDSFTSGDEHFGYLDIYLIKDDVLILIQNECPVNQYNSNIAKDSLDSLLQDIAAEEIIDDSLVYTTNNCIYLPVFRKKIMFTEDINIWDAQKITKANCLWLKVNKNDTRLFDVVIEQCYEGFYGLFRKMPADEKLAFLKSNFNGEEASCNIVGREYSAYIREEYSSLIPNDSDLILTLYNDLYFDVDGSLVYVPIDISSVETELNNLFSN